MTKCLRCNGKMIEAKVQLVHQWGDELYIFRNVPAHVCEECGEQFFRAEVLKRIDQMREAAEKSEERVEVPTMDYGKSDKAA